MPPKKAAAAATGDTSEGTQAFKWEGANDFKLLLLIQGRHALPDEYEQLATAFPGVSTGGIRNRISNLRVKQRELYDSLGWTLPESVAGNAGKRGAKTTKKRGADESCDAASAADETPKKVVKKRGGGGANEAEGMGEDQTPRKKRGTTAKKRSAEEVGVEGDVGETPVKKARGGKGKKEEAVVKKEEEEGSGVDEGVKAVETEDEV